VTNKAAIVGAGLAGLSCARTLRLAGFSVDVFEQDHIIGGRLATTRIGTNTFDHGAPYVSARSKEFNSYLSEISGLGYAERWTPRSALHDKKGNGRISPWIVGTPGMASLVRPLAESVRVSTGRRVHGLERRNKSWHVWFEDETSAGPFQAVAVAAPASEAHRLLRDIDDLVTPLSRVRMAPCWSLMVTIKDRIMPEQDVFSGVSGVILWIARNNTKPGRNSRGETIVVHATPSWSRQAEDLDPETVAEELWGEVSHALGLPPIRPSRMTAHLWRQGLVDQPLGKACLYSSEHRAGIAGDWCIGPLAEHAFESGTHLGREIANSPM
jgi:hypothetical protein